MNVFDHFSTVVTECRSSEELVASPYHGWSYGSGSDVECFLAVFESAKKILRFFVINVFLRYTSFWKAEQLSYKTHQVFEMTDELRLLFTCPLAPYTVADVNVSKSIVALMVLLRLKDADIEFKI